MYERGRKKGPNANFRASAARCFYELYLGWFDTRNTRIRSKIDDVSRRSFSPLAKKESRPTLALFIPNWSVHFSRRICTASNFLIGSPPLHAVPGIRRKYCVVISCFVAYQGGFLNFHVDQKGLARCIQTWNTETRVVTEDNDISNSGLTFTLKSSALLNTAYTHKYTYADI